MSMVERVTRTFVWAGAGFEVSDPIANVRGELRPRLTVTLEGRRVVAVNIRQLPGGDGDGSPELWDGLVRVIKEADRIVNDLRDGFEPGEGP